VRQVTVEVVISAPREQVFDLVADLSRRPSFTDHYLKDFRLARANPVGRGAAARFLLESGMFSERGEISITECDRPRRIVEQGRVGRLGRSRLAAVYDFIRETNDMTRVRLTTFAEPRTAVDRFKHRGIHRWIKRQSRKSLERLRKLCEEPGHQIPRAVSIAGFEALTNPRFGAHVPAHGESGFGASESAG